MNPSKPIDADFVEELCKWVDTFTLTRVKKDLNRDFSDACLVAEIIAKVHPGLVEVHNYPACSTTKQKIDNWNTLRAKVLKKIGLKLTNIEIENLANWRANAIEIFLGRLKENLESKKNDVPFNGAFGDLEETQQQSPLPLDPAKLIITLGEEYKIFVMNGQKENIVDRELVHDNEDLKELYGYYNRISELESKMESLKSTLKAKDKKIIELETQFNLSK